MTSRIRVTQFGPNRLAVIFPFRQGVVTKTQRVPGRFWDPQEKFWTVPAGERNLRQICLLFGEDAVDVDPATTDTGAEVGNEGTLPAKCGLHRRLARPGSEDVGQGERAFQEIVHATLEAIRVRHMNPRMGEVHEA